MPISEYLRSLRAKIGPEMVLMPGICAVVINDAGEILFHRASDDGHWYLIGGGMDPGEEPSDAAVREVWEETGVHVIPERIIGVYTDPLVRYPNGDEVQYICIAFACRAIGGEAHAHDEESLEVRYFSPNALPEITESDQQRIAQALKSEPRAFFRVTKESH